MTFMCFFSSRRRHTRSKRDWSSDVCSSDLGETKLMMEKIMKWTGKAQNLNYVSLRYFNVAGARETAEIGEDHRPETHQIGRASCREGEEDKEVEAELERKQ